MDMWAGASFNPCFIGRCIARTSPRTSPRSSTGFNPCFIGRCIASCCPDPVRDPDLVSILVLLEGALRGGAGAVGDPESVRFNPCFIGRCIASPGGAGSDPSFGLVSILVLLEGALRDRRLGGHVWERQVSILVLLEGALRARPGHSCRWARSDVSILVLLEGALRGVFGLRETTHMLRFNPCFIGRCIARWGGEPPAVEVQHVSILVLLEGALRGHPELRI